MIDRLIVFALTQRVFVLVLVAALIGFGGYALSNLPIEAFPDVQDVQVRVISQLPGQAPEDMERAVTLPIERELSGTPQLLNVRSVTMTGLSILTLTFADGTDNYFARQQVTEKLSTVTLPAGVQPQLAPLSTAVGEIYRYTVEAPGLSDTEVRTLQDWTIRPVLRMTPGVADVVSFGGAIKEYRIEADPLALRKYQVTLDQLSQAASNGNGSAGGGLLRQGDASLVVRSAGLYASLDDIRKVVIAARQGRAVTIGDVAEVREGERPRFGIVAADQRDSIVEGIVSMTKGGNPAKINAELKARIAQLQTRLPAGVKIVPIYDRTELVRHTVTTVAENLVIGALLVIAVLVVFLSSWRAALVVATVIPLALLFAFILMNARGVSANLISLGAVDFGIIIDSAVVIVEALMVRLAVRSTHDAHPLAARKHRLHVLHRTMSDLSHPVLFSKAIIILAFVPIFTFQRVEGKIFTPVALTLSFALLGAVLLTFTLLPTLLSYVLQKNTLAERHKPWLDRLQQRYQWLVGQTMRRGRTVLCVSAVPVVLALLLAPRLGSEFLPKLDEGNIWLTVTLPTSASLDTTKQVERLVRAKLFDYTEVAHVIAQAGRPDDGSDPKGPNNLEILVDLKPRGEWKFANKEALVADMSNRLNAIPGISTNFSQVIQDNVEESLSGFRGEIVAKISGDNLDILEDKGAQVASVIQGIRGATDVEATRIGGQTEVVITPDRSRLARYGLSINDVDTLVNQAMSGVAVTSFFQQDKRFDVVVRVDEKNRNSVDALGNLQLALPGTQVGNGPGTIALSEVATVEVRQGASRILREAGSRSVIVKVNLLGRDQGSFVEEAQRVVAREVKLPPGYDLTWGGQFENSQRATKRLMVIIPLTVLLIFSLLFWAFRSVRLASLVLGMVPFTLIGGLAALGIAGLHLSVSAAVGFIAVAGISVQNGVIMVEEVMQRVREGAEVTQAIVQGAAMRLRPILMTALMAGLGLLPAALSRGIGSETQRPFACVIVGGIVTGTVFTLLALPVAMRLFGNFSEPGDDTASLTDPALEGAQ
ncbi:MULTISPECIES: CusA/CzcA family heavy metal efflux RND transporter [unclassified Variovorax]|uniref:efflux RND transporter permease subunit n=1 Tax=unclassified Variovorax TaxID=663243 RepID=UPI0025764AA7|nr:MULTISPECIES: CusA/CzcA family heavy metal efflux RND transporter [unclassified Variovorax]MDM0086859.1 CusA/CzcA family heavy metal efflux RND transporter [Variovorax sp. J22G40]MDM0144885.1 CusA/CzcA family heavy metal efflux RND transporter [Variovorax sp. J2P1-31]